MSYLYSIYFAWTDWETLGRMTLMALNKSFEWTFLGTIDPLGRSCHFDWKLWTPTIPRYADLGVTRPSEWISQFSHRMTSSILLIKAAVARFSISEPEYRTSLDWISSQVCSGKMTLAEVIFFCRIWIASAGLGKSTNILLENLLINAGSRSHGQLEQAMTKGSTAFPENSPSSCRSSSDFSLLVDSSSWAVRVLVTESTSSMKIIAGRFSVEFFRASLKMSLTLLSDSPRYGESKDEHVTE